MWTVILITALVICVVAIFLLVDYQREDEDFFEEDRADLEESRYYEKDPIREALAEELEAVETIEDSEVEQTEDTEEDTEEDVEDDIMDDAVFADEDTELEDKEDATTDK